MTIEIVNPWTGQVDYRYAMMDGAAVETKLAAAERAFPMWSTRTLAERAEVLNTVARALRAGKESIAGFITAEMGKLRREALAEIEKSAGCCAAQDRTPNRASWRAARDAGATPLSSLSRAAPGARSRPRTRRMPGSPPPHPRRSAMRSRPCHAP